MVAGKLGLPPLELGQLREQQGLTVYRFGALQLAQTRAGGEPRFLSRGGKLIPLSEVNARGLRALADRIASHLEAHAWPGEEPLGLMGSYQLISDSFEPKLAGPREQAMVAMALARYARTAGVDPKRAQAAAETAERLVIDLTRVDPGETDPLASAADAAAWLLAADATRRAENPDESVAVFAARAGEVLKSAWEDRTAWGGEISAPARAMIVLALTRAAPWASDATWMREAATEGVRGLFRETPRGELVSLMPWLGWAELELVAEEASAPSA